MGARQHPCTLIRNRGSMMKIVVLATLASFAMLSVASAADLPRRQPPPVAAAAGRQISGRQVSGRQVSSACRNQGLTPSTTCSRLLACLRCGLDFWTDDAMFSGTS